MQVGILKVKSKWQSLLDKIYSRDVAKRQAKYYQIKSKYYVLLRQQKEKKTPVAGNYNESLLS